MSNVAKNSFLVYYDNEVIVCRLSDDEAGKLFKSLFPYGRERIRPDFENSPALAMAFDVLALAIDRNDEKYERRCEKNRENGRKGGLAKASKCKQSLPSGKQGLANLADRDKDRDKDKDKGRERDSIKPAAPHFDDEDDDYGMDPMELWNQKKQNASYQQIADMYNNVCVSFPRLTKMSEKRKKAIKARLRTYTLEDFRKLFEMAEDSSFLKGQNNRNWSATFDWLINDGNMAKVLDGNYQDKGGIENYAKRTPDREGVFIGDL